MGPDKGGGSLWGGYAGGRSSSHRQDPGQHGAMAPVRWVTCTGCPAVYNRRLLTPGTVTRCEWCGQPVVVDFV